ncbi:MAG: hypothetical protein ACJAVT_002298 [Yoonia sp.]|jgi:hypothetical protein
MLPPFGFKFHLDLGAADSLPLCICQRGLAILTSEIFLQLAGGSFSTHNSNGTFLQSRKHFGQSGEPGIRCDSHAKTITDNIVTNKCDKNPLFVMFRCDILQEFLFSVMHRRDAVKSGFGDAQFC